MAPSYFPMDEAYLVGGWLASFFWGFYTLLFIASLRLIYKKRRQGINVFTTTSIVLLYTLATTHIALALVRLIQGFIIYRDTIGPIAYFANVSIRLNVAKDYIYITSLFVGDMVVVWRLHVVWGRNLWVSVFPIVMTFGELIAGYGSVSHYLLPHPTVQSTVPWGTAMFVMSMATNIIVTAAIASRIWYITRKPKAMGLQMPGRYTRVLLLIIESGVIITAAKVTEFTLFRLSPPDGIHGTNALYIVFEVMPQITGIVPTMIVYAVNSGYTQQEDTYVTRTSMVFRNGPSGQSTGYGTDTTAAGTELEVSLNARGKNASGMLFADTKSDLERATTLSEPTFAVAN
ncbi:hypothetical protein L226DRAFT_575801 [Lentinus tigrinus ALCF2SS1-7]|uniref:Integral membrane protein n=1 Tax=Lentinus tigrinus ALCF2SS1-6 TaxID=1328759 RepID=A0A5C2RSU3_9APHY|nr:hypothetical protein L227DRAFT_580698 [Lentinus tigrinus ALCF2SS1-6]RPD69172.1 hypothetical protein L226DRAFT_575801 [Lentinus tigrinus ALCF2SS1-7]